MKIIDLQFVFILGYTRLLWVLATYIGTYSKPSVLRGLISVDKKIYLIPNTDGFKKVGTLLNVI